MTQGGMFWKIYFWIFAAFGVLAVVDGQAFTAWGTTDLLVSLLATAMIFALAYDKKLGSRTTWKVIAIVYVLIDGYYNCVVLPQAALSESGTPSLNLVGIAVALLSYWAVFAYAWRRSTK